jgi:hypothetical protein
MKSPKGGPRARSSFLPRAGSWFGCARDSGPRYYVLRPLAIVYSRLFRALREILALLVWIALWVLWLGQQLFTALLWLPLCLLKAYVRLRHGREAGNELRQVDAQAAVDGIAWRRRFDARLAQKIGWPTDGATNEDPPPPNSARPPRFV